ncbi:MAG: GGDEF domain-containing protein [Alphaproteobacteria bacterium]|nr:GGDEF domain-containing protein [Alphaproteobacteria bacterium]MBL6954221.1 GGDEF domain-containing protein [Alphaproteobacteria bacterium]
MNMQQRKSSNDEGEKSFPEPLLISNHEIKSRKKLLDFTVDDEILLKGLQPIMAENLEKIVTIFYERQLESPEVTQIIGNTNTLIRLRRSMRSYIMELFEGCYDTEYVNNRMHIGKIHQRLGVSPKLYLAAQSLLQNTICEVLLPLIESTTEYASREQPRNAIRKLLTFDAQLIFDAYISTLTEQLHEMSVRDSLTKLYNQRGFHENLIREIAVAERKREALSLIYLDLNCFKKLNDNKGHAAGDRLLGTIGMAIETAIRQVDFGCRIGGDEFCLILPGTGQEQVRIVFDRIVEAFEEKQTHEVTFSAGIVQTGPEKFMHHDNLVKHADTLMYKAKAKSRAKGKPGHHVEFQPIENYG